MSRPVLVSLASVLLVAIFVVAYHSTSTSSSASSSGSSRAAHLNSLYYQHSNSDPQNANIETGTSVDSTSGTSGPTFQSFPIYPTLQDTAQKSSDMLAGGTYAADYIQALLDTNGLTCTLPPEILLNTGTYEGEIFSAQILNTADKDSALYDVGLGVRNFAHSFTRLVELNLRAPCDKTTTAGFTLPCDPADKTCDSSLKATQKLVEDVLPHQTTASKFKVVSDPLGGITLGNIGEISTSEGSPFFLNLQGSYIASGGLTLRAPPPFYEYYKYSEVASIFNTAFSTTEAPNLDGVSNTDDFWTGYYSALVGFQNWLACAFVTTNFDGTVSDATTLFPVACFNKGGQGVF